MRHFTVFVAAEPGIGRMTECGMRNAEWQYERRSAIDPPLQFRIPHSALRTPH